MSKQGKYKSFQIVCIDQYRGLQVGYWDTDELVPIIGDRIRACGDLLPVKERNFWWRVKDREMFMVDDHLHVRLYVAMEPCRTN